jgi:hypothetical protein
MSRLCWGLRSGHTLESSSLRGAVCDPTRNITKKAPSPTHHAILSSRSWGTQRSITVATYANVSLPKLR